MVEVRRELKGRKEASFHKKNTKTLDLSDICSIFA
jgi:hypothetical protein